MSLRPPPRKLLPVVPMVAAGGRRLAAQVVRHMEGILEDGQVEPGGRLPSERTVAADLQVSRNTVTAAYTDLEQRGLIRRIRGKGSFRCNPCNRGESFSWSGKVSSKAHLLDEPVLEMLARSGAKGIPHPFSAGTPSLACFPTAAYRQSVNKVIAEQFPGALAVAPTEGQDRLRRSIGRWMGVEPNRVMITSGGQEAIDLLARCLIEPGDYAIVESPTYPGAIQSLRAAGAQLIGWSTNWDIEELEALLLRYRPKLLFTTPTFQNPTGRVMPVETRKALLELASRYHLPVLEDDVYAETYLDGRPPPEPLFKLDRRAQVVYISTFSKMLAPGLRVGWMIAPLYMIKQLSLMKMRANLFTGGLSQLVLSDLLESGEFKKHLGSLRRQHCVLRNTAVAAAQTAVEEGLLSFTTPAGGLYLWCRLPAETDMDLLLDSAEARGVSLAPGHAFFPQKDAQPCIRLCFTATGADTLREGIDILTRVLREAPEAEAQANVFGRVSS